MNDTDVRTVTVELPVAGLVALCEVLATLERKGERGDWWAQRMRNLGAVPALLRAARPVPPR